MICQNEKTETCTFALSLMKDLMKEKLNGAIMKPKFIMADNAASIRNACNDVLEGFEYVTCQQHFRMSYKEKSRSNFVGTEKDKKIFISFTENLLTECSSPKIFNDHANDFENWLKEDKKRYTYLINWWSWWHSRRYLWSDAFRNEKAPKTNEAEKGNSRYRSNLGTTRMDLLKATESHTFEHITHVNIYKMFKKGLHIPASFKRGRSKTLQKIEIQEQKRKLQSPVSQKHASKISQKMLKKVFQSKSETENSTSENEKDTIFMAMDDDMRTSKVAHPKVGSHKPPDKAKTLYHTPKKQKTITEREMDKIKKLLSSKPKIVKHDNGEFTFSSNTGKDYNIKLNQNFQCSCPAFKFNKKSQKIKCKHILCTLVVIGVKDELNYNLTDLEEASVDTKIQNFNEQRADENIELILSDKGKKTKKQPLPSKPSNCYEKFKSREQALLSLKSNPQHCKWIAVKAENNRSKCPSHEKESKGKKRRRGEQIAEDITTGQLILVACYQRILKERGTIFGSVGERRCFHTDVSCVTNLPENWKEWTSITVPSTVKCRGLSNKEIEFLQKQFTNIRFEKENMDLQQSKPADLVSSPSNKKALLKPAKQNQDWLEKGLLMNSVTVLKHLLLASSPESDTYDTQERRSKRPPKPKHFPKDFVSTFDKGSINSIFMNS